MNENEKDDFIYDEEESVDFIQNYLPPELKEKFGVDDIYYIVDIIYDFYEQKGFLDEENDVEIDEDELIAYVIESIRKDGIIKFTPEEITYVVQGELGYCESIGMFE